MKTFTTPLKELREYNDIKDNLKLKNTPIQVTGCIDSQKCHLISGLSEDYPWKLIITYNDIKAKEIYEDYKLYDKNVFIYPAKDIIFYSADIHGNAIVRDRLKILKRLLQKEPVTVITTLDGGMDRILPLEYLKKRIILLEEGGSLDLTKLQAELIHLGYERQGQVEGPGEFAVRGGILDIFPPTEECPYRVELWGDEVDSIRSFDIDSQRSIERISSISIYPAAEMILTEDRLLMGLKKIDEEKKEHVKKLREQMKTEEAARIHDIIEEFRENIESFQGSVGIDSFIRYFYDNTVSFFDYFKEESIVFLDEPGRIGEKGEAVENEFREGMIGRLEKGYILPGQSDAIYGYKELLINLSHKTLLLLSTMDQKTAYFNVKGKWDFTVRSVNPYNNNFDILVQDLIKWKKSGYRVLLLSGSRTRAKRLSEDLREHELNAFYSEDMDRIIQKGEIMVAGGNLHRGFEYPLINLVIISESDIFGAEKKKRKKRKEYDGKKIQSFTDLNIGDYVVHENHGLGIYRGIEKIEVDKVTKDYMKIEYGGGGVLYILATGLDVIQKYAGADAKKPKLNKLNSPEWKNTKTRVKGAVKEIAKELVALYATRQEKSGYQFGPDTVWQNEFEEMFPYEETDDQLRAIEDTKRDMESTRIMDRLVCGDVGYGKTEIAIRAAFKAVSDGKQVVFLVPTTILAQQHYNTFVQRMMDFPVSIDMLSRFKTPAQQKAVIERAKKGSLDILIGTHRVLSKDIKFKNLGLLMVDEEQRFGVTHKEKIKTIKENIDVLTLTATPIPRTLHMSLIGIRDMSVLTEPPVDRIPIQTYVLEHNEEIIREAIHRELARDGQVYYVYNRVNGIDEIASKIARLVPEANVSFAHGQMSERELERIMFDFINGEIDVLVSTTIIETGLDISNVNTMIIDDADRLGLSQLYQLRGRVGRSNRTAYAFLMYKRDKMLKEIAEKRLQAIKEFTELGSGFKIAMRDLEIRGAGNLLGAQQSGHMEAVGYDLYCKMLNDAVRSMRGETNEEETFDTTVDMDIDAFIPATYIKSEFQKLDVYKRIAEIENEEELLDMQEELLDRFGDMPASVNNLLNIAFIKSICHSACVTNLVYRNDDIKLVMYNKAKLKVESIPEFVGKYQPALKLVPEASPYFIYSIKKGPKLGKNGKLDTITLFEFVKNLLNDLKLLLEDNK
ncbi:transcription-repair-coupling factor [Anaerocolumna cellulosilytica]|uniref:Transcription-repair-coupling factor n=1 Tax=Anaerocolumna cellulosilytica TaxID=433286 RepID=A0A6S6QU65_9FIRM|nr:transcription-repair coupling factor [Anaerocolumna cellulosilytica]MBB5196973.1 transcription-repair coupling factor (superfamily II helicase) [Anaerocolumna cellulosilytica]BCJ92629.1 transcription-repair-coupling factor [Anaerocolumna cellulosilytica]